jgi:hypothetical protein
MGEGDTWVVPEWVYIEDGNEAWCGVDGPYSEVLALTGFGFEIPAESSIHGVIVRVKRKGASADAVKDSMVRLVVGDAIGSSDRSSPAFWPAVLTYKNYGSSSDVWEELLTPAIVNATSDFGCAVRVNLGDPTVVAAIDYIQMIVYYDGAGFLSRLNRLSGPGIGP